MFGKEIEPEPKRISNPEHPEKIKCGWKIRF
jgi:hypothetical protein